MEAVPSLATTQLLYRLYLKICTSINIKFENTFFYNLLYLKIHTSTIYHIWKYVLLPYIIFENMYFYHVLYLKICMYTIKYTWKYVYLQYIMLENRHFYLYNKRAFPQTMFQVLCHVAKWNRITGLPKQEKKRERESFRNNFNRLINMIFLQNLKCLNLKWLTLLSVKGVEQKKLLSIFNGIVLSHN